MVYKVNQTIIMVLRFLTSTPEVKIKAQIQKRGRLGFSMDAIKKFQFDDSKGLMFAVDEQKQEDAVFYGLVTPATTPGAIKFNNIGNGYVAVDSPNTFKKLGFDFKKETFIFTIEEVIYDNTIVLKFTRRAPKGNYPNANERA